MGICDATNLIVETNEINRKKLNSYSLTDSLDLAQNLNNLNDTINLKLTVSNIKGKNLITHYEYQNKNYNNNLYVMYVKFNNKDMVSAIGIGKDPIFKTEFFTLLTEIKISELINIYFEILIYEIQNDPKKINLKNVYDLYHRAVTNGRFFSGLKIDLFSIYYGSEHYNIKLNDACNLSSDLHIGRLEFDIKCDQRKEYKINMNNILLNNFSNSNCKYELAISYEINNEIKYSDYVNISQESLINEIVFSTKPITLDDLKNSFFNLVGKIKYEDGTVSNFIFNLNRFKEQILYRYIYNLSHSSSGKESNKIILKTYNKSNFDTIDVQTDRLKENNSINMEFNNKEVMIDLNNSINISFSLFFQNMPSTFQIKDRIFTENGFIPLTNLKEYLICDYLNILENDNKTELNNESEEFTIEKVNKSLNDYINDLKDYTTIVKIKEETKKLEDLIKNISSVLEVTSLKEVEKCYLYSYSTLEEIEQIINSFSNLFKEIQNKIDVIINNYDDELETILIKLIDIVKFLFRRSELNSFNILLSATEKSNNKVQLLSNINYFYINIIKIINLIYEKFSTNNNIIKNLVYFISNLYHQFEIINKKLNESLLNYPNTWDKNILDDYEKVILYKCDLNNSQMNKIISEEFTSKKIQLKILDEIYLNPELYLQLLSNILEYNYSSSDFSFPFSLITINDYEFIIKSYINFINNKPDLNKYNLLIKQASKYLIKDSYVFNKIIHLIITRVNAYDVRKVFISFSVIEDLVINYSTIYQEKLQIDFTIIYKALLALIQTETSFNIAKILTFYYNTIHLIDKQHIIFLIENLFNKKFFFFALHWSWTLRSIFFRLLFFIFKFRFREDKLIDLFNEKYFELFDKKKIKELKEIAIKENINSDINTCISDYFETKKFYENWVDRNISKGFKNIVYPEFIFNLPYSDGV